jgi:hypothetical protein
MRAPLLATFLSADSSEPAPLTDCELILVQHSRDFRGREPLLSNAIFVVKAQGNSRQHVFDLP